jgi:hypothetical protein
MTSENSTDNRLLDPVKAVCWLGVIGYLGWKAYGLQQGATLRELFDFGDPSLAGLTFGACVLGLILRSPKIRRSATLIEANETRAVVLSFAFVFTVMGAYYILRAVRDSMASDWTDPEISALWTIQFFLSRLHLLCRHLHRIHLRLLRGRRFRLDRQVLLHLGEPVQPVPSVRLLELHGRHLQPRAIEAAVRLHRRRRQRRRLCRTLDRSGLRDRHR